ncbi:hypothetical protein JCM15765_39860 [Paradesulfitobacterium aromaticivorans]
MAGEQEIGKLLVRVGLDSTGFLNNVSTINRQMRVVQAEFEKAKASLGQYGSAEDQERLKAESLIRQIELQKQKVAALQGAYEQLVSAKSKDSKASQDVQVRLLKAQTELAKLTGELKRNESEVEKDTSLWAKFSKSVQRAGEQTKSVGDKLSSSGIGKTVAGFAGGIAVFEGAKNALKGITEAGIGTNAQLEQNQIAFQVLTGSAEQAKQTVQDLYQYSASTPFEFPDVSEAGRTLQVVGLNVKDTIKWVGDLAAANPQATIGEVASAIARLKSGDFGEAFERLRDFGISREMLTGAGLEFDKGGSYKGSVEQALTAVQKIVQSKYGGMADAQSKTFSGMMSTLKDNVNMTIGKVMEPVFNKLKELMPTILEQVGRFSDTLAKSGLGAALNNILPPGVVGTFKVFGEIIADMAKVAFPVLKEFFLFVSAHGEFVKAALVGMAAGFAALKTITAVVNVINTVKTAFTSLNAAMGLIGLASNPIGWIVIAVGALAVAGYELYKHWDQVKTWFFGLWEGIKNIFSGALNAIVGFLTNWGLLILAAATGPIGLIIYAVTQHWEQIKSTITHAAGVVVIGVKNAWTGLTTTVSNLWSALKGKTINVWDGIKNGVVGAAKWMYNHNYYFKDLVDFAARAWLNLQQKTTEVWNLVTQYLNTTWALIQSAATQAWGALTNTLVSLWNSISDTALQVWDSLSGSLQNLWQNLVLGLQSIFTPVRDFLAGIWNRIEETASSVWNKVANTIGSLAQNAFNSVTHIFGGLRDWFSNLADEAWDWGANIIRSLIAGIKALAGQVANAAGEIASKIAAYLGFHSPTEAGPGSGADQWMPNLMKMLTAGIQAGAPKLQAQLNNVLSPQIRGSLNWGNYSTRAIAAGKSPVTSVNNSYSYGSLLHTDKIVISGDMDIRDLAYKLEFYRGQAAAARGGA